MLIIGTFQQSIELEQALSVIEKSGIPRDHIMVVAMDAKPDAPFQLMTKSHDPYSKAVEVGFATATASTVIGTSFGFILAWGPILCGLFAAIIGFFLGYGVYSIVEKNRSPQKQSQKLPEITVIIQCAEEKSHNIREILWSYRALTVGRTPEPS
ncbi:hypothetical protein [Brevibacillus migulae]|uniref:hypothetical protein n=1 Tax=Brevibacillus migulae TaxID=1644114 RepID=UPI00106E0186|nr:hypothetical protein [Brevibacillus migulae]